MLTIGIDTKKKEPIYEQIYKYIRNEIKNGTLTRGTRLPSSRKFAEYLDVSRNTIDLAYSQLLSEGYVESKPKKGYFVADVEEIINSTDRKGGLLISAVTGDGRLVYAYETDILISPRNVIDGHIIINQINKGL